MKHTLLTLSLIVCFFAVDAQSYFPAQSGNAWDTISPSTLGWCTSELPQLNDFLDSTNSRSFIVLKDGKIAIEWYMNGAGIDSAWYWASAGKSLVSFLYGTMYDDGLFNLSDKTSDFLGKGWTSAPAAKEDSITIWNQLSMTSGLDDTQINCIADSCLLYKADAGKRWAYHNGPYWLLQDMADSMSGRSMNLYASQKLRLSTGITGLFLNYIFWSKPRSMARFGLLMLNKGVWAGDSILKSRNYFDQMINSSQSINPGYGLLWWLNGKDTLMSPVLQTRFATDLIASAPKDLYAAMGKNEQRIYVIPSENLVIVRVGNTATNNPLALSTYDEDLWQRINKVICNSTSNNRIEKDKLLVYPNPTNNIFCLKGTSQLQNAKYEILTVEGKVVQLGDLKSNCVQLKDKTNGIYLLKVLDENGTQFYQKLFVGAH